MKHSNINIDRPELSPEQIAKGQNFDKLLRQHQGVSRPWYKNPTAYLSVVGVAVVAGVIWFMAFNESAVNTDQSGLAYAEETSNTPPIAPPLTDGDESFSNYTVIAELGDTIEHGNSTLIIPPNVLADEAGNLVTGEVEISYREFHDKIDVMLSGIPMAYDSAGTTYHFETGGMMEVRGYQNGKALSIVPDCEIQVQMSTRERTASEGKFNFYVLDEEKGEWGYLSKAARQILDPNALLDLDAEEASESDSLTRIPPRIAEINYLLKEVAIQKQDMQAKAPQPPIAADPEAFQIELAFDEAEFPELAAYSGTKFEVDESVQAFDPEQGAKEWNNVTFEKAGGKGRYNVTFFRPGETYSVVCRPVLNEADMDAAVAEYEKRFEQYQQDVQAAEALQAKLEQERKEEIERQRERMAQAQAARAQWQQTMQDVALAEASMTNFFAVNSFGIYNCDAPRQLPKGKQYSNPRFFDSDGDVLVHGNVYLLIEGENRVINYFDGHQIQLNPNQINTLVTITEDKQLAVIEDPELDALEEKEGCEVKMYVYPDKIQNAHDVRRVLKSTSMDL